jgi:hypothetical protein
MGGRGTGPRPLGERAVSAAEHKWRQRKEEALQRAAAKLERLPHGRVVTRREAAKVRRQAAAERRERWWLDEREHFETEPHRLVGVARSGRYRVISRPNAPRTYLCEASCVTLLAW